MEARRLFPRLLQLIASHPEIKDEFVKHVSYSFAGVIWFYFVKSDFWPTIIIRVRLF
jgi:hypothetical protein